jgi:hypothetical protein
VSVKISHRIMPRQMRSAYRLRKASPSPTVALTIDGRRLRQRQAANGKKPLRVDLKGFWIDVGCGGWLRGQDLNL